MSVARSMRRKAERRRQHAARVAGARRDPAAEAAARTVQGQRVVYGARCCWWDSISAAGSKPSGLPCCPHCGGVLMETDSEATWWEGVDRAEAEGRSGYRALIEWSRGRCFLSFEAMEAAYAEATR